MPAIKCDHKWKYGTGGKCVFKSKAAAERAGRAIHAAKNKKSKRK